MDPSPEKQLMQQHPISGISGPNVLHSIEGKTACWPGHLIPLKLRVVGGNEQRGATGEAQHGHYCAPAAARRLVGTAPSRSKT